jgi:ribosomal protein S18 acetylase RimI-like enzyme
MQHKGAAERAKVVAGLWRRGAPGDARAIERILEAAPSDERPALLRGPAGTTLHVALADGDAEAAAALLAGTYWNDETEPAVIASAQEGSTAWVGAKDEHGTLCASARALSDGAKHAWIYDVIVREDLRGRGVGDAVVRLLLEHPGVRRAANVHLGTRDAMAFYGAMGFVDKATIARPYRSTEMVLRRHAGPARATET